ncbi:hypothetical protein R3P38DRAFT_3360152 [Favolaschia claudopus]|uniref:DUF6535 domain-containing protein n=1 Tax=Favolaschia claudopus TaxID=2862362 RepID=A0AAW0AYI5_9AGAR
MSKCRDLTGEIGSQCDCLLPFWHNPKSQTNEPVPEKNGMDVSADEMLKIVNDSPFERHCANNAEVWKTYLNLAKRFDEHLVASVNNSVDPLLIFAGLFSAILTAFLIEIRTEKTTNSLLFSIVLGQHTISDDVPFQPVSAFRWINGLWFTSLLFSLGSALGASVAKGWATPFSTTSPGSGWSNARVHSRCWYGTRRWHLNFVVQSLPLLIHLAVFLFGAGLAILLFQDDRPVGVVILALMTVVGVAYLAPTVLRATFPDFPFRTPISGIVPFLFGHWDSRTFAPFPSSEDAQKGFALAWLLRHSLEDDAITDSAIRAVAGLPFLIPVQDELVRGATASTISNRLSAELLKETKDPVFLRGCLFALLHLVQTKPLDPVALRVLYDTSVGTLRNIESMPTTVHEVALCVTGRILLFSEQIRGKEQLDLEDCLFETDIPVLANCFRAPCLYRSLREVCHLRGWQPSESPSHDDFVWLKSTQIARRQEAHAKLIAETSQDGMTVPKLRTASKFFLDALASSSARAEVASFLATAADYEAISDMIKTSEIFHDIVVFMTQSDKYFEQLVDAFLVLARNAELRTSMKTAFMWKSFVQYWSRGTREAQQAMQAFGEIVKYDDIGEGVTQPEIESQLIQFLENQSPDVRESTIGVFVNISPKYLTTSQLLPKLVNLLDDESSGPRLAAVHLFNGWTQDSSNAEFTSRIWHQICGMRITFHTLVSLSELTLSVLDAEIFEGGTPQLESIAGLIQALEADDIRDRYAAVRAIRFLAEHSSDPVTGAMVTTLLARLGDELWVSDTASEAIWAITSREGFRSAILSQEAQEQFIRSLKKPAWLARRDMLRMLTGLARSDVLGASIAIPLIPQLLEAVEDSDEDVREAAITFVISLYDYNQIRPQLSTLRSKIVYSLGDLYANVRLAASKALRLLPVSSSHNLGLEVSEVSGLLILERPRALRILTEFAQYYSNLAAISVFRVYADIVLNSEERGDAQSRAQLSILIQTIGSQCMGFHSKSRFPDFSARAEKAENLNEFGLEVINFFTEHDKAGAAISVCEMILAIFSSAVKEVDAEQKAKKFAAIASIEHDSSFDSVIRASVWKEVEDTLRDINNVTKDIAQITVVALAQQGFSIFIYLFANSFERSSSEIIHQVITMLHVGVNMYTGRKDNVSPQSHVVESTILTTDRITETLKGVSTQTTPLSPTTIIYICGLVLLQLAKTREMALFKALIPLLPDSNDGLQKVDSDFSEYDQSLQLLPEQLEQVFPRISDSPETRHLLPCFLVRLLTFDALPSGYVISLTQNILRFCQDTSEEVQEQALMAVLVLAKRDRGRGTSAVLTSMFTMMSTSELEDDTLVLVVDSLVADPIVREYLSGWEITEEVILSKLRNTSSSSSSTKRTALNLVEAFLKNAELCASIAQEKKIFDKIGRLLMHPDADIQEATLKAIFASSTNETARRLVMSTGRIVTDIVLLLDHGRLSISELAFDTVELLLPEDRLIHELAKQETLFRLLARLGGNEFPLRERAFKCLSKIVGNRMVKEIMLTKKCIQHLFEMLHGRDEDRNILSLVDELVKEVNDEDFGLIATAFIQQPLKHLVESQQSAILSDSYIEFIKKLPRNYQVSPDDTLDLMSLLSNSNSVIVNRAGALIKHFAQNASFRQKILNKDVWGRLLQTDDAELVVEILNEFAKASGTQRLKVPYASGIMAQLLSMTKVNSDSVGRWRLGWNGLLALGVFSSDEEMARIAECANQT